VSEISTWADGFGVWHARVPVTDSRYRDALTAQAAIAEELAQREGPNFDRGMVLVEHVSGDSATTVYREITDGWTLPEPRHEPYWTTDQACAHVAKVRGIGEESARRWLGRHVTPLSRETGREGQNLYVPATVRDRARPDTTLPGETTVAGLYHD